MPELPDTASSSDANFANLIWPVGAMFSTQTVTVILFLTVPVMATEIAPEFGIPAKDIGVFMSIVFAAAMVFSAASGSLIRRYGGIRANQIGMTFSAVSLLLALSGSPIFLFLAAALVGIGYGPNTPSGAHILARVTPPRLRAFVFSLKQSGAPIGGVIAGILIPTTLLYFGWRGAILVSSAIAICAVIAIQPLRKRLDNDRDVNTSVAFDSPMQALRRVLTDIPLRRLTLVAFCLTSIQAIVLAFLIIILVQEVGMEFRAAGALFGAAQAAGAFFRVAMGWLADRVFGSRHTIVALGLASACACLGLAHLGPNTPFVIVVVLSVATGAVSFAWNGVFLAEVVSLAGAKDAGTATGGALFFLYAGIVFGPMLMSLMVSFSGGFSAPLYAVAVIAVLAVINLWRTPQRPQNTD